MIKKRIFSFITAVAMSVSSAPFLASVIYTNTASTPAYAEGEYKIPELDIDSRDVPDLDSFKFAADMELGWNLGNTLDAVDNDGYNANKLDIESSWCGVKTTKEMIDSIKKSGFKTIRIPVSWHNHIDENNNIDKEWLDRVQEIVDYAVANDMHIILNIHHDNDLGKDGKPLGFYPEKKYLEQSLKYVEDIWTQVAGRFKDYDNKLVFESLNEPRLLGSDYEWNFNASVPECAEAQECINAMNQKFVDVVRASGGKNADRYLMVPAYCANAEAATSDVFKMPEDTAENKLMLEVHAYIPYFFAMAAPSDPQSVDSFDVKSSGGDINTLMDKLYLGFISKNIPVIVDEFGAINKNENVQARTNYAAYYIAAARARGITCCWWDNNAFTGNGENFGLLDRASNTIKYQSIIDAMAKYAGDENTKYVKPSQSDGGTGLINKTEKGASVVFSKPIGDKVEIEAKLADNCNMVTGGVGFWIGGSDGYWVSYNYELTKSGTITIDFNNPTSVSHTVAGVSSDVTDKAEIQTLIDSIKAMNSIDIQVWYSGQISGDAFENPVDGVEFTSAKIAGGSTSSGNTIKGIVNKTETGASAIFDEKLGDTVEVDVKLNENTGSLMGCIDFSVALDGKYYWIAYEYNVTKSGTVKFDLNKPSMVNLGEDPVKDEALKAKLIEAVKNMDSFGIQCWYASDKTGAEITPSTDAGEFTGARIIKSNTQPSTNPTEPTTNPVVTVIWGDANNDDVVEIADVVALAAYVGDQKNNPLSDEALNKCDVHAHGNGINANDILMIQQYLAEIITTLEVSAS